MVAVKTESYMYAVIEVGKDNEIRIEKTTDHTIMMNAVRSAIARRNPYTVIRKQIFTTV